MKSVRSLLGVLLVTGATVAGVGVIGLSGQSAAGTSGRAADTEALPKDINPESRSRLAPVTKDQVDARLKNEWDAASARSGSGKPEGAAYLRLHRTGVDVRWDAHAGRRLSELSIISTAREHDQPYEWSLHHMEALSVGVEPSLVDIVNNRKPLTGLGEKEAAIIQVAREIGKHRVTPETYARAVKAYGEADFIDLIDLMAGYGSTAVNLTAANQFMPPQMKQFLVLPFTPPNDILPDSRSRIPVVNPNRQPAAGGAGGGGGEGGNQGMYRRTLAPPPTGPGSMAKFANGLKALEANVGKQLIDLAALVTAREYDQQYLWTMNELTAIKDGLAPATIDVVRTRKPTTGLGEKEAAIIDFGRELHGKHNVSAETYARAKKIFGQENLSDFVVNVMAPNSRDAILLTVFDQRLPAGQKPLLPTP